MPGIDYTISAHNESFVHGMHGATEALKEMQSKVKETMIKMAEFAGISYGIRETLLRLKETFKMGGELEDLSLRTGASVKDLAILQVAFKNAGMSAEEVGPLINRLQKSLTGVNEEGQGTAKGFEFLHLKMEDLRKMSTVEQFDAVAKAIQKIHDPAVRTSAVMSILGRSGGEALPLLLTKDGLEEAAKSLGGQADMLEKNAASFHRATISLDAASVKIRGLYVGVAAGIAGPLTEGLEGPNSSSAIDNFGKYLGDTIQENMAMIFTGNWWTSVGLSLQLMFEEAINPLLELLREIPGMSKIPLFDVDDTEARLNIVLDEIDAKKASWNKVKEEEKKDIKAAPAPAVPYTPAAQYQGHANRLSQIGFDMGNRATQTLAEKTAKFTEKTATNLDKLLARPLSAMGSAF